MRRLAGFGLVEVLLAMSLGLLVVLAASRVFVSGLKAWQAQTVSTQLQEDARFALMRLARDVRNTGMLGCLSVQALTYADDAKAAAQAFARPLQIQHAVDGSLQRLVLISADEMTLDAPPDWTVLTDCVASGQVFAGAKVAPPGQFALPIRRHVYRYDGSRLLLSNTGGSGALIDNLSALHVTQVDGAQAHRLHVVLTLSDPLARVRDQTYRMSTTLRNRLP